MWHQLVGTAMGHVMAPPYACLTIGYLEEDRLFKDELPKSFNQSDIEIIEELFKRYMDDGSTLLPHHIKCESFLKCLNNLHPNIEYTLEPATEAIIDDLPVRILNFLDISIIMHQDGRIETDIHYKPTNSHKYLDYNSFHPSHCKDNIPYTLAKRIVVFVSDEKKMKKRLKDLKIWLLSNNYPQRIIEKAFHNSQLQGPANRPKEKSNTIPLITTYMNNYDANSLTNTIRTLISSVNTPHLREILKDVEIVGGHRQPKNLQKLLTCAKFGDPIRETQAIKLKPGIFAECKTPRCDLCKLGYIQTCTSFICSNGERWEIKCHINCNSKKVLYYQVCNFCQGTPVTNTGKTKTSLRTRTNNHISCCRSGKGSNLFDNHVYECGIRNGNLSPPFFKLYAFMRVSKEESLLTYERYLHRRGFDTINSKIAVNNP